MSCRITIVVVFFITLFGSSCAQMSSDPSDPPSIFDEMENLRIHLATCVAISFHDEWDRKNCRMPGAGSTSSSSSTNDKDGDSHRDDVDCDDNDHNVYPGSIESCDLKDNNCNGTIDEGFLVSCDAVDTDGDAIADIWESNGYDYNNDGVIDVDLPAMGASPVHKDIFVELDWEECTQASCDPHSDRFSFTALNRVRDAYSNAPVNNPDGTSGIVLHIDAGPDSYMKPNTVWGQHSRANPVGHKPSPPYDFNLGQYEDFLPERRLFFHHAFAAHNLGQSQCTDCQTYDTHFKQFNGYGWGGFFTVTQGAQFGLVEAFGGFEPNVQDDVQTSSLFMHELGHSLCLHHGGHDAMNRKPNHLSVMNYSFSYRGLRVNGKYGLIDYQRFNPNALDEASGLDEVAGISDPALISEMAAYGTIFYRDSAYSGSGSSDADCTRYCKPFSIDLVEVDTITQGVDWNQNGTINGQTITNFEGNADTCYGSTTNAGIDVMTSHNEWDRLCYRPNSNFYQPAAASSPALQPAIQPSEPDINLLEAIMPRPYVVNVFNTGLVIVKPGTIIKQQFLIFNRGDNEDRYRIDIKSTYAIISTGALEETISLAPNHQRIVSIDVKIPDNAPHGMRNELSLKATSSKNPYMSSTATNVTLVALHKPTAKAEVSYINDGTVLLLDGSTSISPSGHPLRYRWYFSNSNEMLFGKTLETRVSKLHDEVLLVVNDGFVDSDTVKINLDKH